MILYLDTSSLVKLYIREDGSDDVRRLADDARLIAAATIAYPETRSAFARLHRGGFLDDARLARVRDDFASDWTTCLRLQITEELCLRAGDLAEDHGLRGFDSIHLAAYLELRKRGGESPVHFSAFDDRLNQAVEAETAKGT